MYLSFSMLVDFRGRNCMSQDAIGRDCPAIQSDHNLVKITLSSIYLSIPISSLSACISKA